MSHTAHTASTAPGFPAVAANPPVHTGNAPAIAGASSLIVTEADAAGLSDQIFDGPWSLDEYDIRDAAQAILSDRTGETVCDVFVGHRAGDCEARARLIAEAPAMVAALRLARDAITPANTSEEIDACVEIGRILSRIDGEA